MSGDDQGRPEVAALLQATGMEAGIHEAAYLGDIERMRALLIEGVDPNGSVWSDRQRHLHLALDNGHTEIVQLLLEWQADANAASIYGETTLINAVRGARLDHIRMLLAAGADVNLVPHNGEAALLHARGEQVTRLLIEAGAYVDGRDGENRTALMMAAAAGWVDGVELLSAGADINCVDDDGWTAITWAEEIENVTDMIDMIERLGRG